VLIVMVQFPDDDFDPNNAEWPLNPNGAPQPAPVWVQNPEMLVTSIDQHAPNVPFTFVPGSLSEYFYKMSQNAPEADRLKVYGDVVHQVFPFTREEMRTYTGPNNPVAGMTLNNGLNILFNGLPGIPGLQLPPGRTYATYDNWTTTADYQHGYQPDPVPNEKFVDLVIICWRNIARDQLPQNVRTYLEGVSRWNEPTRAHLRWDGNEAVIPLNDGHKIQISFGRTGIASGSSIWFKNFLDQTPLYRSTGVREGNFRGLVHEVAHHLLSGTHFYGGPWSMISNSDHRSYAPTAFEMAELGWIQPTFVYKNQVVDFTETLGDLYTTGDAVAIEIDATQNRWYFLENHQMVSPYDFASSYDNIRNDVKGLYVLYHNDYLQSLQSATGSFDWTVAHVVPKLEWNANVPAFTRGTVNPQTGYTRSEIVDVVTPIPQPAGKADKRLHPIILINANNAQGYTEENHFSGKYSGDQHTMCTSGVWGPTTNPSNTYANRNIIPNVAVSTETSFRIVSETNGVLQVRIANNNVDIIPPARVTSTTVPTTEIPNPVVAYNYSCTTTILIEWAATVADADFDHFLITGGDAPVTAATTATSASINITVIANEGYATRLINVFSVDVSGNVSCNSVDGVKECSVLSCPDTQQKMSFGSTQEPVQEAALSPTVYPQPTREEVTIEVEGTIPTAQDYELSDAMGRGYLVTHRSTNSNGKASIHLRLNGLPCGVYSTSIITTQGIIRVPVIIY